jgi:hypothetical protein
MSKTPKIIKEIKNKKLKEIDYSSHSMISYSQFSTYKLCPHKWATTYKDKNFIFSDSIHTIFGTSIHESLQHYLQTVYDISAAEADRIDLTEHFRSRFSENYRQAYTANNKQHFTSPDEMETFFEHGLSIINHVKKNRRGYFPLKQFHLVGIEMPVILNPNPKYSNVLYKGLLDLVLYNETANVFYIYDIKTSTYGWNEYAKKDEIKQFQLILYKHFFSELYNIDPEKIKIQYFIVRRIINENLEFPPKRVQEFSPASGKIKTSKALNELNLFIEDCFEINGKIKEKEYNKNIGKHCQYCPFNETPLCSKYISS